MSENSDVLADINRDRRLNVRYDAQNLTIFGKYNYFFPFWWYLLRDGTNEPYK